MQLKIQREKFKIAIQNLKVHSLLKSIFNFEF